MVLFSIGMPGRFSEWCDAIIARLAERAFGAVDFAPLDTLEQLAAAAIKTQAPLLVGCTRQPGRRLQTEIVQSGRPFVIAISDPRMALRNLVERGGYDVIAAIRGVASSCAAIHSLTGASAALVVSLGASPDATALAAAIADHLQLPASGDEIGAIVSELAEAGLTPELLEDGSWWDRLDEREQVIAGGALSPYFSPAPLAQDFRPIVWEPELFYANVEPPAPQPVPAARAVDITGRVRYLVYGPFIDLPPGPWSANVVLGVSPETAGMSFLVEVFAGRQLTHTRIEASAEPVIEANLHFVVDHSVDQPVQIRIVNERVAFDGQLALGYVAVTRQSPIPVETRDHLSAVLRR